MPTKFGGHFFVQRNSVSAREGTKNIGGSVCESNTPKTGRACLPTVLKTVRITGPHALPRVIECKRWAQEPFHADNADWADFRGFLGRKRQANLSGAD